jgi:hypothetical protein
MTAALVPNVMIDRTHMRRRHSGIERVTEVLFSPSALAPLRKLLAIARAWYLAR